MLRSEIKEIMKFNKVDEEIKELMIDYYMDALDDMIQLRTLKLYNRDWNRFIDWYSNEVNIKTLSLADLNNVKRKHAQSYVRFLSREGKSVSSIRTYRTQANVFFEYLVLEGYIEDNEFGKKVKYKNEAKKVKTYYSLDDASKLLSVSKDIKINKRYGDKPYTYQAIITLILKMGLRKDEVINMKKSWYLDYKDNGEMMIKGKSKGGKKERLVILFKEAIPYIEEYINSDEYDQNSDYMFTSSYFQKEKISASYVDKIFNACKELANVSSFTPHKGRRIIYETMKKAGYSDDAIKNQLGHESINTTNNYYKQMNEKDVMDAAKAINEGGNNV